jgi:Flp pilus assembly pilin Flp
MRKVLLGRLALLRTQSGQSYTEYGIILFLIGITVICAVTLLGQQVYGMWHQVTASMPR